MTVYADILFAINFSMDFISLYITGRLLSLRMITPRVCAAAAVGSLFSVLAIIYGDGGVIYFILCAVVSAIMCFIAYKNAGIARLATATLVLFCVGSALGGMMTAVYSLGEGYSVSDGAGMGDDGGGTFVLLLVAATAVSAVIVGCRALKRRVGVRTVNFEVTDGGRKKRLLALLDSGNLLCEPISGRPAIIIRADRLRGVIPAEIEALAYGAPNAAAMSTVSTDRIGRVRILPTRGAGGGTILFGYVPDEIRIRRGNGWHTVDAIIALSGERQDFGGCDAILPAILI
ncbi:MAG: sigma-E processing peptidase SpoIIGA [Clostridiales bacterium]|nr:sigma-E processing peptidase SpoIIGA [Clostridiales bacterium]